MKSFVFKQLLIVACFLLTHCTTVSDSHLQVNQQLATPYTMPVASYLEKANHAVGKNRQTMLLMAAGRLIQDGELRQAGIILARIKPLSYELADEKKLLLAKIELIRERPRSTIKQLADIRDIETLPLYSKVQYHEMLAKAYKCRGNVTDSVAERIKLGSLLPDLASRNNNFRELWLALTSLSTADLNTMIIESGQESELKGWASLAIIARRQNSHPEALLQAIESWQKQYPRHTANALIHPKSALQNLFTAPRAIALLLPMSGPLAGPGKAVRDGFMAAYRGSKQAGHIQVLTYDTNKKDAGVLYERAVNEGADYIVGPLSKANAAKVSALKPMIPTVLLNDLNTHTKNNTYQFGLSPSNEARQVASRARRRGYTRALVIGPDSQWGNDVASAFTQQWQANGGTITDTLHYKSNDNLNQSLRDFLHISASEARKKELKHVLKRPVESTPRRRQDFDMIFLLAYPSKARQIMPLLKYYYAGNIPVYSTSSVYGGYPDSIKDRDLNSIIFCDMPWVFNHNLGHKNWPEQLNSYNRLYALGMDSYALSRQLNQLLVFPAMGIRDKSGVLYLNPNGQIGRILAWGTFKQGLAQRVDEKNIS